MNTNIIISEMPAPQEGKEKSSLIFFVNGCKISDDDVDPEWTLIHYLRIKLRLTGTKLGCAEGGCGACTVVLSKYDDVTGSVDHYSVNACLYPLCAAHGLAVTTVEGIGNTKKLHPIQEKLAEAHGSQCGFCTPGFVMSMYALLRNHPLPTQKQVESAFEGNLCRCTGYRPILDGMKYFTKEANMCGMGEKCCKNTSSQSACSNGNSSAGVVNGTVGAENGTNGVENGDSVYVPRDASQDVIFPSDLKVNHGSYVNNTLTFIGSRASWIRPVSLDELLTLKADFPDAKLINGNTEVGVEVKFKNCVYPTLIYPALVPELKAVTKSETGIEFGSNVTLTRLDQIMEEAIEQLPGTETRLYSAVREMLRWFAGHQIRNVSAIGGNISTASPISDLNPLFMAANCKLKLQNKDGYRDVMMDEKFFTGYRRTILKPDEIIVSIQLPRTRQNEYFYGYKQAHRREDDIAIVNAGMRVLFQTGSDVIQELSLCYGGMAPTTVKAISTCQKAVNRKWDESLLEDVCSWLEADLPLDGGAPGGSILYRRTLTTSFFYKFFLSVNKDLYKAGVKTVSISPDCLSATEYFQHHDPSSSQAYQITSPEGYEAVGQPMIHTSAYKQVTGEAIYTDDLPTIDGELHLAFVYSTKAHARILNVDYSKALLVEGVVDKVDHHDVPGSNLMGIVVRDEEIFVTEEALCIGQILGGIVAIDNETAHRAAKLVTVEYQVLPHIITIEEAIDAESFYLPPVERKQVFGDIEKGFAEADIIVKGEQRLRGQEHFYLEGQVSIAIPGEDDSLSMFISSQSPTSIQSGICRALNVPAHKVEVRVKRMGGAFGGKETRCCVNSLPVAIAARKLNRPVRCILDRDEDMAITGGRHPFYGKYKVGATKDGRLTALDCEMYNNGGCSQDLSIAVMEKAMFSITNAYYIPNVRVSGQACRTNLPSNTAFRTFGAPQAMLICEQFMDHVARELGLNPSLVREKNLFVDGNSTHFSAVLHDMNLKRCWADCVLQSDLQTRSLQVERFNENHRLKKRGISTIPTLFGIGFEFAPLMQAGALCHVYTDGSVLLTHGGTEMGQGLHTKMIQVASQVLQIPVSKIYINETSTSTVPNTTATAASTGSDLNGGAVMDACQKLVSRLKPVKAANPKGTWEEWIIEAYFQRISLSATGFYKTPLEPYSWETNTGTPFNYYTMGVACSEVEIDCLTGDHKILRTDIVMDVGKSLNPTIDIGQIEGAFVQGYGYYMLEELRYSPDGFLYTRGPGMYKIPSTGDIPTQFNVTLLKETYNPSVVYSSKAIGEPPLFLSASVFFAVKDAIRAYRHQNDKPADFSLLSPASAENIRMACEDQFTEQFTKAAIGGTQQKAWDIVV